MIKFLKSLIWFIVFAIGFYSFSLLLWGNFSPKKENLLYSFGGRSHTLLRLQEADDSSKADILVLGSSHAYHGFDPNIFRENGIKIFVLSTSSQSPIQTEYLLDKYLDSFEPKKVIYEICPNEMSVNGIESIVEIMSNSNIDWKMTKMAFREKDIVAFNSWAYALLRQGLFRDLKDKLYADKIAGNQYVTGGYVKSEITYNDPDQDFDKKKWVKSEKNIESFERILKKLKSKHIEVLLVRTPKMSNFYNSYMNNDEFNSFMKSKGSFIDFNTTIEMNDSLDFIDFHHLSQRGVNKFNNSLVIELNKG